MSNGHVFRDDNNVPATPLYDNSSHQIVNWQSGPVSTDSTTGEKYAPAAVDVTVTVAPTANQRVNAQSGDFVAGAITDLATLLTLGGTPTDANTVNSLMGRLTKIRDLLNATLPVSLASLPALAAGSANIGGVELIDSAGTNKLAIDASGRITLAPNQTVEIVDSAGTNKLAVDASGRLTLIPTQTVTLNASSNLAGGMYVYDSAGTNKLAVDASGRLTLIPNSSVNMAQVAGTTASVNSGTIDAGTQRTVQGTAATGTKSNVASSASSVTILASNTSRKGAMIYNDSTQILYLDLSGGTASATSYSLQIPANGFFELPGPTVYNGAITGIWAAANGNARVTEFS